MDPDLKRFAQAVRRQIRLYVRENRAAPPMLAFVPEDGWDPRRTVFADFGEAADQVDVRATIRESIEAVQARFFALARTLVTEVDGEQRSTSSFGLAVVSVSEVEMFATSIFEQLGADKPLVVAAWEPVTFSGPDWHFVQHALELQLKARAA